MKKVFLTVMTLISMKVSAQYNTTGQFHDTTKYTIQQEMVIFKKCLIKQKKQWRTGMIFTTSGVLLTSVSFMNPNPKNPTVNYIVGSLAAVSTGFGVFIMLDSHKWFNRLGVTKDGVTLKYTF